MPTDLDTIVCHARGLSADERAAYLEQACAGDADLRAQLEAKLTELAAADAFFADKETLIESSPRVKELEGAMIGHYKLLQQIGEGGFGTVWIAEQQQPVRRRVALILQRRGLHLLRYHTRRRRTRRGRAQPRRLPPANVSLSIRGDVVEIADDSWPRKVLIRRL